MNVVSLPQERSELWRGPLGGRRVLLVEDSGQAAADVAAIVRAAGGRLRRADGLSAARRHITSLRPDIVIVDPGLHDGDGLVLVAELRRSRLAQPRIVVVSGEPCAGAARLAGADATLAKPAGRDALLSALLGRPMALGWRQIGAIAASRPQRDVVADLRKAQLALLEAKLCNRLFDPGTPFGLQFVVAVIDASGLTVLDPCRDAALRGDVDATLAHLRRWLHIVDPIGPPAAAPPRLARA